MKEKTEIEDKIEDAIYRNIYTDLDGGLYGENEAINELTALFNTELTELWKKIGDEGLPRYSKLKQLFKEAGMKDE